MPQEHVAESTPWTRYLWTLMALVALTLLSFALSFLRTGAWEIPIALLIAVVKSVLVLLFFMHLVEQKFINAFAIIVAVSFLALLLSLVVADVATRRTFPPAPLPALSPPAPALSPPAPGGSAGPPPEPLPGGR
ncbi:cytochrome C oxidase subunit IV family protein [Sorangium sp. So ce296]|uniref:cytochrome C oxidase subunit IV family protein n=1 Tax=Sorangium sp. So ce296 TaxID=3133296 RepID=UPI003F5DF51C